MGVLLCKRGRGRLAPGGMSIDIPLLLIRSETLYPLKAFGCTFAASSPSLFSFLAISHLPVIRTAFYATSISNTCATCSNNSGFPSQINPFVSITVPGGTLVGCS
jgi:hypothetical protein